MSKMRQAGDRGVLVRTYGVTHPRNVGIDEKSSAWDQLAYASQGVMSVHTTQGTWVVPPHRAVWIPAGVVHRISMSGRVTVRTLFFARGLARRLPRSCRAVNVTPLLRELILRAVRHSVLWRRKASEVRLMQVILDEVETLAAVPLQLPMPRDPRARRAAELVQASPSDSGSLTEAARTVGASRRTLERLFRRETHMTMGRWRQRARLIEALKLLAAGQAVTRVSLDVGYESPSAFVSAFRRQLGTTPGRYFLRVPTRVELAGS